jgi:hypothetical protein
MIVIQNIRLKYWAIRAYHISYKAYKANAITKTYGSSNSITKFEINLAIKRARNKYNKVLKYDHHPEYDPNN